MVRVRVVHQNLRFRDDEGTVHELRKGAVPDPELDEKHLGNWWIKAHIAEGNIVVVKASDSVAIAIEDMTVYQLKEAIAAMDPDFDWASFKKKADYVEALKELTAKAEKGQE